MEEEKKDVKPEEETPTPVQSEEQPAEEVTKDVENEQAVDRKVYEKVREDMKAERAAKREERERVRELEERIAELESRRADDTDEDERDPRIDVLYAVNKDPFVKENLDLIEQKMSDDPRMDLRRAVSEVKAEIFDRIQKEVGSAETNKPPKQEKPTATDEPKPRGQLSTDPTENLKKALRGEVEVDPRQLEAIRRYVKE